MTRDERTRSSRASRWARGRPGWLAVLVMAVLLACDPRVGSTVEPNDRRDQSKLHIPTRETDRRPIRLTGRDGTDMPLMSLAVRGTVEDPLAFTELHLEFENPEPRAIDATLEMSLPKHARVTRFAAQIEGSLREAEVVERKAGPLRPSLYSPAEVAVDPNPDGDQHFVVTLPDVPGRSTTEVILSYVQTFPSVADAYRVRLAGLENIPRFSARVVVHGQPDPLLEIWAGNRLPQQLGMDESGRRFLDIRGRNWSATEDFVVPTSGLRRTGVRSGRKVAIRLNPLTHDHAATIEGLTILFDTSASRAVGYHQRVEELAKLVEALQPWTGNEIWLRIIAFDQSFETVYQGPLGGIERETFDRLHARRALGASNLAAVLRHVATGAGAHQTQRVLLFTDGMATAGVSERSSVLDTAAALADEGVERIDVIADEGRSDPWTLRELVRQLPESGLVLRGEGSPRQTVRRLMRTVHDDVHIEVPAARWSYPEVVDGLQSDDEVIVYADVETLDAGMRVVVESHGTKHNWVVPLVDVEEPLVGWALESARVDFLVATLEDKAEGQPLAARKQLWRRIVQSSKVNRVVNDYTRLAMLVDESDYRGEGLDPAALPGVLFAGPHGVEARSRGVPNALLEEDVPLAHHRLPRFPRETLAVDQLLLLAQEDMSSKASGLSSAEADAVMAVGELVEPSERHATPVELPAPDEAELELSRMRLAKPLPASKRPGRRHARPPARKLDDAYQDNMLAVMNLLEWGDAVQAKELAWRWREAEPTEVMAVVALGEALEANDELDDAIRAYGSIIDMFPDRADMRRFAGTRVEHLGTAGSRLAIDTYRRARQQHPDQPSSHRLLAFALLRARHHERAFDVLVAGLRRSWSDEWKGVEKVLREDLGLIATAWAAAEPGRRNEIRQRTRAQGARLETEPSLRFVLTWETGANDVDLHVRDVLGSHAYYEDRGLRTGGALYYDVTSGFGPEVFTIIGEPTGYPYNLQVHYYARGPNGYGMGKVQVVQHDGSGRVAFDERPFVVMTDRAVVDLGDVSRSLLANPGPSPLSPDPSVLVSGR